MRTKTSRLRQVVRFCVAGAAGVIAYYAALYVAMTVSFLIGNTVFLYLMVEYLHMWYIGAQVILTAVISVLNFIISGSYVVANLERGWHASGLLDLCSQD